MTEPNPDAIVTSSITITRRYWPNCADPDSADTVSIDTQGNPTLVESLGLLEFAKASIFGHCEQDED